MAIKGRNGARQLLLQACYQMQLGGHDVAQLQEQFKDHPDYAAIDEEYFLALLADIVKARTELDAEISRYSNIPTEQLDPVEHAILWIALAELSFQADVPPKVVMNEAIELAKSFGAEGGHRFVNGLLDKAVANR